MGKHKKSRKSAKESVPAPSCDRVFSHLPHSHPRNALWSKVAPWVALGISITTLGFLHLGLWGHRSPFGSPKSPPDGTAKDARGGSMFTSKCGLYLAESSIPGAGLGVYSGFDVEKDDEVGHPDICIQLIDGAVQIQNHPIKDYPWTPDFTGGIFEATKVDSLCPGVGMLANSYQENVGLGLPTIDDGGLHRSNPGAGAITSFHNVRTLARRKIPAGSEVFLSYGKDWFAVREHQLGKQPTQHDFDAADKIAKQLAKFARKHGGKLSPQVKKDAMVMIKNSLSGIEEMLSVAMDLIPEKLDDVVAVSESGTAQSSLPNSIRTPKWLDKNGLCIDNIRAGNSTKIGAGRGAFATRRIPEGGLVAPSKLIHFSHHGYLEYNRNGKTIKQLLLNYCFGHPKSTLLFFPISAVVNLINHDSTRPNARIQWSRSPYHQTEWISQSPDVWADKEKPDLLIEYIATRDIQPGEEIFIDYGPQWEESWEEHSQSLWMPPRGADTYVEASVFNKTAVGERLDVQSPYPNNLETACFYDYTDLHFTSDVAQSVNLEWKETQNTFRKHMYLCRCQVLSRTEGHNGALYRVTPSISQPHLCKIPKQIRYIYNVPRRAIVFVDKPYTSNQHLGNAFRHPIGIPDEIFPEAWKNAV